MTSKEALETIANIELYHKEIYEDEDFEGDWTYDETCEYDGLVCEVYKQEIDTIKQNLERFEALEKENKKWLEIVGCDLCEALGREILLEENEKLKALLNKIYKNRTGITYLDNGREIDFLPIMFTEEEIELMGGVGK